MKMWKLGSVLFVFVATIIAGCDLYPDDETRAEDTDIILTRYDQEVDFSNYHTYSLVDEVMLIDDDNIGTPDPIPNSDYILSVVEANMSALGYEKVNVGDDPDVRLFASATEKQITYYYESYYSDYYYWYGGGWYGYGGWWGYPCCGYYYPPYYPVVETYEIGTLFMDMLYTKDQDPETDSISTVWSATINGVLEDGVLALQSRIKSSIDQAYDQSPYLSTFGN